MSSSSSVVFCYFSNGQLCLHACARGLLEICVIIGPKWGVPNGNHNHVNDVEEVNSLDAPMLPGSFLHEKEPGYEATSDQRC